MRNRWVVGATLATFVWAASCRAVTSESPQAVDGDRTPTLPPVDGDVVPPTDGGIVDSSSDAMRDASRPVPTGECASSFGSALTAGFGRIDGIVYAVQKPSDVACVLPNKDHVIVQVLMNSAVYRLVVNVQSTRTGVDSRIRTKTTTHALPQPAFEEGWHADAELDYVASLGVHSDSTFSPVTLSEATDAIAAEFRVGDDVSVYATSGVGRPESAHLVHRNAPGQDGALVSSPRGAARFMLFHFDGQTF